MARPFSVEGTAGEGTVDESPELPSPLPSLNNQLGIILAHAELLEAKAPDDMNRAACGSVVSSAARGHGHRKRDRRIASPSANPSNKKQNRNFCVQAFDVNDLNFVRKLTKCTVFSPEAQLES